MRSPIHPRRRRHTVLIIVILVVITFIYTSDHLFSNAILRTDQPPTPQRPEANADSKPESETQTPPPQPDGTTDDHQAEQKSDQQNDKLEEEENHENEEEEETKEPDPADDITSYAAKSRPDFTGSGLVKRIQKLPAKLLPSKGNDKRLIIIGDVHGMIDPLQQLLGKVGFDAESGRDQIIFVGNLVSKGTDSAAVVELAIMLNATSVRGVEEDRILLVRELMNSKKNATNTIHGLGGDEDHLEQEHLSRGDYAERVVADSLTTEHVEWLAKLPAILDVGFIPGLQNIYVSHAGLVPGIEMDKQDSWPAMNMRSIVYPREQVRRETAKKTVEERLKKQEEELGRKKFVGRKVREALIQAELQEISKPTDRDVIVPIDDYSGDEWFPVWNRIESEKNDEERRTVIYGRDTKKGLNLGKNTFGLNTKCVDGEQLTALVIAGSSSGVTHKTVSVDCQQDFEKE